ncbi:hydrogen peroxide-inducible genes activator [Yoonia litorea]|uniref:Transcriptional regulator, LysR family n=1 Tax=Yoonia litorea TaxID=1123755 RepID=A0A1I6L4F0_9RHOB|nr:hydrogen peroxide-inducible genes activator [Yoonia litorea]SFR98351.1 transcriptional regulator, LysR family [Yoonia litorea]
MANFTLRQLRYFEALSRFRHFGHAADACAISQPALSVQIKELEQSLGVALFERSARSLRLTSFGETWLERVREILRNVDELSELARAAQSGFAGRLRLGVIPTIAPYLLPSLIGALRNSHPQVSLDVRETLTERLIEELTDGRIDAAIVALPIDVAMIAEMPLFVEKLMLVRHVKERQKPVPTPENLHEMRLLMLEQGHCFRDQAFAFCNLKTSARRDGLDGSSLSTLVQMVGAGIGVTLIPEMAVTVETRNAPVTAGRFPEPQPERTVGLIWRRTNPLADQFRELGKEIMAVAGAMDKPS